MAKLLLDTHSFLWWVDDDKRLRPKVRSRIRNQPCAVSLVTLWELAIKASLGKIRLASSAGDYFSTHVDKNGFDIVPIEKDHLAAVEDLPFHHNDLFDRLLVAQVQEEGLTIVSVDPIFDAYKVKRIG